MPNEPDHYAVLGLPPSSSDAEIKRRYRRLMREVHPDANARDPDATSKAARINRAYETLGNPERRRAYDARRPVHRSGHPSTNGRHYADWAQQPDWEDIVAEHVPPARPAHAHTVEPEVDPREIEVDLRELRGEPRIRRRITVTNHCDCTLRGTVATSEAWVWGPIGEITIAPHQSFSFEVDIIGRKVTFPGLSRVLIVTNTWTGTVPVRVTGYAGKPRRTPEPTAMRYVRSRRAKPQRPRR
ncbi:MAG: DnaJ domain-containing protein [Dehalococcoidia bacterium]